MLSSTPPDRPLTKELGLTSAEIAQRKEWLEFGPEDEARIRGLREIAVEYASEIIEDLYHHFFEFSEVRSFFEERSVLEHVKTMQREYFMRLTQGDYDDDYVEDRLKIGAVHERVGVDVKWYLGAYNHYVRFIGKKIFEKHRDDPEEALRVYGSLQKLIYLDIGLAIDTYIFHRERTIRMQQEAIRELSTPVLSVRPGVLILPIVGAIDSQRARQLTGNLLRKIREERAKAVVLDVTGVPAIDTQVANHLLQTVESARLMGARAILTGISTDVAQALVTLGVDLGSVETAGDLQQGLTAANAISGYRVVRIDGGSGEDEQVG